MEGIPNLQRILVGFTFLQGSMGRILVIAGFYMQRLLEGLGQILVEAVARSTPAKTTPKP